jgi:hypothetical protein
MANNNSIPKTIYIGAIGAVGGLLVGSQFERYAEYRRKKKRQKAWKAAPDQHKRAALQTTYPNLAIEDIDITVYDDKAAKQLYGVVGRLEVELPRRGLK